MAKLSAYGRKEVVRFTKVWNGDDLSKKTRTTRAVMSDGIMLEKVQWYNDDGTIRPATWRKRGKIAVGMTPRDLIREYGQYNYVAKVLRDDLLDEYKGSK